MAAAAKASSSGFGRPQPKGRTVELRMISPRKEAELLVALTGTTMVWRRSRRLHDSEDEWEREDLVRVMEERLISMSWWEKRSFHARKRRAELMRTPRSGPEHQKIMKAEERKRKAPGGSEESGETAWESMRSPWKSMKLVTARMKRAGMMREGRMQGRRKGAG